MLFTDVHKNIYQILKLFWCCKFLQSLLRFSDNWVCIFRANIWKTEEDCGVLKLGLDVWSCVNSDYSLAFQPQSVSNFIPVLCICTMECSFLLKDITWGTYCLAVIQTMPVGFFYLNQEHVWMLVADFMYTMPMIHTRQRPICWKEIYGHGNHNVAVLMVKCLWFYIIKTVQPWKYLLKCFKIYYKYWFVDGQNEKSRDRKSVV